MPQDLVLTVSVVLVLYLGASAGDVYEARALSGLPQAAHVRDDGRQTSVFLPHRPTEQVA